MNSNNRKRNNKKARRVALLSAISVAYILLIILIVPAYSIVMKLFYAYFAVIGLVKIWSKGMRDYLIELSLSYFLANRTKSTRLKEAFNLSIKLAF